MMWFVYVMALALATVTGVWRDDMLANPYLRYVMAMDIVLMASLLTVRLRQYEEQLYE